MKTQIKVVNSARLDKFLATQFPEWSRTRLKRLINDQKVLVDGKLAQADLMVKSGQKVSVEWPKPEPKKKPASLNIPLPPILFEDNEILVVNKPPGLVVHPAAGHFDGNTLVEILSSKLSGGAWPDETRSGLIHRLDRDTSGVIVLAKTPQVQIKISRQFSLRQVKKTYVALVLGKIKSSEGKLECHISRHPGMRQRYAVSGRGRWAMTKFKVQERFGDALTLVELYPFTGRTHQLRVQLSGFGHPIIGDVVYGDRKKEPPALKDQVTRQLLHASQLELTHPRTGLRQLFKAPWPEDFLDAVKLIRFNKGSP